MNSPDASPTSSRPPTTSEPTTSAAALSTQQATIAHVIKLDGLGLFSGRPVNVELRPAEAGSGITFVRRGNNGDEPVRIPALIESLKEEVALTGHRTVICEGDTQIETIEHVMAALSSLGIDNIEIHVDSHEIPGFDGSAARWCDALIPAGRVEQDAPRPVFRIAEPVFIEKPGGSMIALPDDGPGLTLIYELDYGEGAIGRQVATFTLGVDDFVTMLATARSFATYADAQKLRAAGIAPHLSPHDFLVIDTQEGPVNNAYRFPNECARHKVLDMIGDLLLFGGPIQGRIIAKKTGHADNHEMVRRLRQQRDALAHRAMLQGPAEMDVRQILELLPHRYPMLMVDRVVRIESDQKLVAVKNVTMNELFFQGHYPQQPIMPGVLIIEAMAQTGGLLMTRHMDHEGKIAVLLSIDGVKLRRPVVPGDQLVLEAEAIHIRSRIGHVKCTASVAGQRACEAEIKFMILDANAADAGGDGGERNLR